MEQIYFQFNLKNETAQKRINRVITNSIKMIEN